MSDSDRTHYAVGSGESESESSDGIPRVGEIIAEKYRVDRMVGIGGMGVVLAVTHLQIQEPYAIKFLLPRAARDAETVARFLREARAAVRIKSEHIARVSDVGQTKDGTPFIVMELLEGSDLGDVLADRGPLPVGDAVEYVLQACEGIAEAHALGIVHRDLKPANLFLTRRSDGVPFVKVLDFGISKAAHDAQAKSPTLTDTSSVFGSPAYMSPEQIRSAKNVDARSDVWALGIILHELLTGRIPFDGETSGAILSAIAADAPARVRASRPDVPEALEAVVLRCLSKSAEARFANVAELASALDPFKSEAGIASIGRIQRLTSPPAVMPAAESARSAAPSAARRPDVALAETDAPVTRGEAQRSGGSRATLVIAVAGALLVGGLGALGLTSLARARHRVETGAVSAAPSVLAPSMAGTAPSVAASSPVVPSSTGSIATATVMTSATASAVPPAPPPSAGAAHPPKRSVASPRLPPSATPVVPAAAPSPSPAPAASGPSETKPSETRQ